MDRQVTDTAKAIASWAKKAREATARRDDAIRRMRGEGASLRDIAQVAELSHTAIAKILARPYSPNPSLGQPASSRTCR